VSARGWLAGFAALVLAGGGFLLWTRLEGTPPEVRAPAEVLLGNAPRTLELTLVDAGTGLRDVRVSLVHAQGETELVHEDFPGSLLTGAAAAAAPATLEVTLDPGAVPRELDSAVLRVSARDWAWRGGLRGNEARVDVPVRIDRVAPRIEVASGLTYVKRGGSGVVVYGVSEPTTRDGVEVADTFFRGYPLGGRRVAIFAVPTDAPPDPKIRVVAEDAAGNKGTAGWAVVVKERTLPEANVTLPESFLENKVVALAQADGIDTADLEKAFDQVNTQMRAHNEAKIREVVADSAPEKLWSGVFEQLANSKVTSRFAERRTYFVGGKAVSHATHFGYDLAATANTPVTAAAAGRVVYAGDLGIYGNCVIIDHGLGLASLYGHLASLGVSVGDRVEKGQVLGRSDSTGLAGGDHLHFAILVGGVYVDPLEWWDPKWVSRNEESLAPTPP
jgi:murein DD-endopeptidase MepM/ murein hydrolase activator NlpD